ncbi:hypothetical protein cypCar_00049537 [Cyprinus carpio]|nr:hypothetical protein cypCar_00049537 [Cyprinus carpio]
MVRSFLRQSLQIFCYFFHSTFKLEDRGQTSGRLAEPICAELEEVNGERHLDFGSGPPTQMIPGEPVMSLPVHWNLGGKDKPREGRPIIQDPLGSSIMVHQQHLGFKEQMP